LRAMYPAAAIVQQDDVHRVGAVGVVGGLWPAHHVNVFRDFAAARSPNQHLEQRGEIVRGLHYFLNPDHDDVDTRQGRTHAPVALVGDNHAGPGFGYGEVGPGDAHIGSYELITEVGPRGPRQGLRVIGWLDVQLIHEQVAHLLFGLVQD